MRQMLIPVFLVCEMTMGSPVNPFLIGGSETTVAKFPALVKVGVTEEGEHQCTGTVVGSNVVLTAAHCGTHEAVTAVEVQGKVYSGQFFKHPKSSIDLAVIVTERPIKQAKPLRIGGKPAVGDELVLLGFGCDSTDGTGGGSLAVGKSEVTEVIEYQMVSGLRGEGTLLCPGDSGGPSLSKVGKKWLVSGVHAAVGVEASGEIIGPNYDTLTTLSDSRKFFEKIAEDQEVSICGVNAGC
jgi:V8-like Glu-specific endopeptidase